MMQKGVGEFSCDTVFLGDDGQNMTGIMIRTIFGIDEPDYLQLRNDLFSPIMGLFHETGIPRSLHNTHPVIP